MTSRTRTSVAACARPGARAVTDVAKDIVVVFRYDDYSSRSHTESERRLIEAFASRGVSVTFGAIPFVCERIVSDGSPQPELALTGAKAEILQQAVASGTVEPALHGYAHQRRPDGAMTEFTGVDYAVQYSRLARGRQHLERATGAPVTTFIPPWHSYDLDTARALEALGFVCLSGGARRQADPACRLKFVPGTCTLRQLRRAVGAARRLPDAQPVIVAWFHDYDFLEADEQAGVVTYGQFVDLLEWTVSREDVRLLSCAQAARDVEDLGADRFLSAKSCTEPSLVVPSFLDPARDAPVYLSSRGVSRLKAKRLSRTLGFYAAALIGSAGVGFLAGHWLFPVCSRFFLPLCHVGVISLVLASTAYAARRLTLGYKWVLSMVVCLGLYGGALRGALTSRDRANQDQGRTTATDVLDHPAG